MQFVNDFYKNWKVAVLCERMQKITVANLTIDP